MMSLETHLTWRNQHAGINENDPAPPHPFSYINSCQQFRIVEPQITILKSR